MNAKSDPAAARLVKEIIVLKTDVRKIKKAMMTKNDVERILVAIEACTSKAQVYDRAAVLHGRALSRITSRS